MSKWFDGAEFPMFDEEPRSTSVSRHVPTYYGIQYTHAGRFFLSVNDAPVEWHEGPAVFATHPGAFFHYGAAPGETRHMCYLCGCGPRFARYAEAGLLPLDGRAVPVNDPAEFLRTLREIFALLHGGVTTPERAVWLCEGLLLQIREKKRGTAQAQFYQRDFFRALIRRINEHPEHPVDFTEEAAKCGMTLIHFRRLFKRTTGVPPHQYQLLRRLRRGTELLRSTNLPVAEIAERCGFEDPFYFSRLFKRRCFLTPVEYRKEYSQ